jgi:hypothetical protein
MKTHTSRLLILACATALVAACGKPPAPKPEAPATTSGLSSTAPGEPAAAPVDQPAAEPAAPAPRNTSPEGASVSIVSPRDGEIVTSPVKVVFGLEGMTLAPAGDLTPNSGHHHLLVDVAAPDLALPLPKDAQHLHFGQAQTEAEIPLEPGQHTLQLLLADGNHVPHNPPLISAPITITVQ